MDTERLRYFCTLAQTQNMQKASELLHISPAAISKALKVLESEVSRQLFVRSGRGIVLSDEGKLFAVEAEKILAQIDFICKGKLQNKSLAPLLRLGSFEVFTTHTIGPLLKDHLGDASVILHELIPGQLEAALAEDRIDLGISYIPIPRPEVEFLKITTIEMGVFGIKGPLLKMPLENVPFAIPVTPIQGSPTKVEGLDGWPDNLIPRNNKYKVTMMESALELCRMGLALSYLPKFVVDLHNQKVIEKFQLVKYPGALPLKSQYVNQDVFLVKRKSDIETPFAKKVAKALRMICR